MKKILLAFFTLYCALSGSLSGSIKRPKLIIGIVIDQFAGHEFVKHEKFLTHGFKTLKDRGTYFPQAYFPHARPATATGHAALSTGSTAQFHGIVANKYVNANGKHIKVDRDKHNTITSKKMMCESVCDKYMRINDKRAAYAISHKSRAAVMLAGRSGKALWFDGKAAQPGFVSNTEFFTHTPNWLAPFNAQLNLNTITHTHWDLAYPANAPAYAFDFIQNYTYAGYPFSLVKENQELPIDKKTGKKDFSLWLKTPAAIQALFDLGLTIIKNHKKEAGDAPLLLWISQSTLDLVGHFYGPFSKEVADTLYHTDKQLDRFIRAVEEVYSQDEIAWAVTADHGVMPIPELLAKQGNTKARRIDSVTVLAQVNKAAEKVSGIKKLVTQFEIPYFYFDQKKISSLPAAQKKAVITAIKDLLRNIDGIKEVWTKEELLSSNFKKAYPHATDGHIREHWFADQYYPGRSGDIIVLVEKYSYLTFYQKGTSHCSPYDYDITPFFTFVWDGWRGGHQVEKPTSLLKLAPTLAHISGIAPPACSKAGLLPRPQPRPITSQ